MACIRRRRGRWVVDFRDQGGKRRWQSYDTQEAAKAALADRIKEVQRSTYVPAAELPTFETVARQWLDTKADCRVSSYQQLQIHVEVHLVPAIGALRIDQITVDDFEKLKSDRRGCGLAPMTINKLLNTAAAVFRHAEARRLVTHNPAALVPRCKRDQEDRTITASEPDPERAEVDPGDVLAPDEIGALINHAESGFYRTFLLTAALTGARVGELTGLTWEEVDLDGALLHIRRSVSWARARGTKGRAEPRFFKPKTKASQRAIPLPPELVSALREWKLQCPPSPRHLVFPNRFGRPRHRSTIAQDGLRPALKRAKLRRVTIHSLRHSFATALILKRYPINDVSRLLGHSSVSITLHTYTHWFSKLKGNDSAVRDLAQEILGTRPSERGSKTVAAGAGEHAGATEDVALSA